MTDKRIACFLVEKTGEMTSFHRGISSPIVRRLDNGALYSKGWDDHPDYPRLPFGAMWLGEFGLEVRTPGGDWRVDRPSTKGGQGWTRTGEPPNISVQPSILFTWDGEYGAPFNHRNYHGVLTNGVLQEC